MEMIPARESNRIASEQILPATDWANQTGKNIPSVMYKKFDCILSIYILPKHGDPI